MDRRALSPPLLPPLPLRPASNDEFAPVPLDGRERRALEARAEAEGRSLSNYARG